MTMITVDLAISLDGYVAGPNQDADNPFGHGVGDRLHKWMFDQPEENAAELEAITAAGAFVMGLRDQLRGAALPCFGGAARMSALPFAL